MSRPGTAIAAGVALFLSLCYEIYAQDTSTNSSSNCSRLSVTGGSLPGTYYNSGQQLSGKDLYLQTEGDRIVAVLRFYKGSARRHRRLRRDSEKGDTTEFDGIIDREEFFDLSKDAPFQETVQRAVDDVENLRRSGESLEGHQGQTSRGRSLAECSTGLWISLPGTGMTSSSGELTYPLDVVSDCAEHPADIDAEWSSMACADCELEVTDPPIFIQCDDSASDADGTPSPGMIATASPTAIDEAVDDGGRVCNEITVSGGGLPGTYTYAADANGRAFYGDDEKGIGYQTVDELRRSRRLGNDGAMDDGMGSTHQSKDFALSLHDAEESGRVLAACDAGVWFMTEMPNADVETYPLFLVADCASNVLGVSQPWFVIDSEGASPWLLSPQPYLECTGTAVLANGDTPAPASSSADSPFSPVASTSSPASLATDEAGNDLSGASAVGFGGDKPRLLGVAGLVGLLVGAFVPAVASAYCW